MAGDQDFELFSFWKGAQDVLKGNLPTTFKVRDASPRPKSDDAQIRELWFKAAGDPTELLLPQ